MGRCPLLQNPDLEPKCLRSDIQFLCFSGAKTCSRKRMSYILIRPCQRMCFRQRSADISLGDRLLGTSVRWQGLDEAISSVQERNWPISVWQQFQPVSRVNCSCWRYVAPFVTNFVRNDHSLCQYFLVICAGTIWFYYFIFFLAGFFFAVLVVLIYCASISASQLCIPYSASD